jgi:hypothetical protein
MQVCNHVMLRLCLWALGSPGVTKSQRALDGLRRGVTLQMTQVGSDWYHEAMRVMCTWAHPHVYITVEAIR